LLTGFLSPSLDAQAPERRAFDRRANSNGRKDFKDRGDKLRFEKRDGKPGTSPRQIPAPCATTCFSFRNTS
jgi:hypothetical protein